MSEPCCWTSFWFCKCYYICNDSVHMFFMVYSSREYRATERYLAEVIYAYKNANKLKMQNFDEKENPIGISP